MNQLRQAARETREALGLNLPTAATVVVVIAVGILIHGYFLDPDTGSVPRFALWLIESIAWALAVAAVFAPLFLWNLIKVVRRQRSIDASRRIATERAASVDDQIKLFLQKSLAESTYGVSKCYAFGSVIREYPTRDVDIVIQFGTSNPSQIRTYRRKLRDIEHTVEEFYNLKLHIQTFLASESDHLLDFLTKAGAHQQWVGEGSGNGQGPPL